MSKILSIKYKQKAFETREVKDETLNRVLNNSLELIKSSPLGMQILKGANYKDVISNEAYESARSKQIFAVEKAYVGIAGKVKGGHCGLISAKDGDKNYENARGEVYINENFIRNTINALGEEKASIYLTNIITHEFMHGKQRTHFKTTPEDSRSRPKDEPFQKNSMTYEESVLAEASAMSAGITVLCSMQPDQEIRNYAFEDLKRMGNLSSDKLDVLKNIIDANPQTISSRQANSRIMMNIFIEGQQKSYKENENIVIDLNKSPEMMRAIYQKDVFGETQDFVNAIPGLSDENKKSISLELDPNAMANHVKKLQGLSVDQNTSQADKLNREHNQTTTQKEEAISTFPIKITKNMPQKLLKKWEELQQKKSLQDLKWLSAPESQCSCNVLG